MYFLDKVAESIFREEKQLDGLTIVLPSERAVKYMQSALFRVYKRPILSPEIITIDRWVRKHSERSVIDKTRALIQLYNIHLNETNANEDQTFDEFLSWGNILLSDYDEIDRYLLDAKQVFKNLADIKELESWNIDESDWSQAQRKFMSFWDKLPGYYHQLNEKLDKEKLCYAGSAFRELSDNIDVLFRDNPKKRFVFAGFNALSPAEMSIMRQLKNMGRAQIFIDADNFYYSSKDHEAGTFLRRLSHYLDVSKPEFISDHLTEKHMDIRVIDCAQNTGQVKTAATILSRLDSREIGETLLLLADESLIASMMNNIPANVGKANITLGLPIRNTAIKTWVELIFSIQENKSRFKTNAVYYKDLQSFWRHPFVLSILNNDEKKALNETEREVVKYNKIFLNADRLRTAEKTNWLLARLTKKWDDDWQTALATIREMNRYIYKYLPSQFAFEKALLECFDAAMMEFETIVMEGVPAMRLSSFRQLFHQHWSRKSIAYHGNPTEGLQIMGLLETRTLDFKRIICIGMNEGNLPPTNPLQTMIPMDLRKFLGLPTPREKQGLFAHHFYRLLHHCEDLTITYSSAEDKMGANEPSRYLAQLELELARKNKNIHFTKQVYSVGIEQGATLTEFPKTSEVLEKMDTLFASSTSASMLRKYLDCPLDFYFRYVMDFGEADEVEEEIENSTFGTFIHQTLEELYSPFAKYDKDGKEKPGQHRNITSLDIEKMLKDYVIILDRQFMRHFNNDKEAFTKGKNLLAYEMAHELTRRYLKSERDFLSVQQDKVFIESLENKFESELELEIHGSVKKIKLKGTVDRVDRIGDTIRIVDYKSGKVDDTNVSLRAGDKDDEDVFGSIAQHTRKYILQLMFYTYLYYKKTGNIGKAGIISLVSGNGELYSLNTRKFSDREIVEAFPEYIRMILEEAYDTSQPFRHELSGQFSYCKYCE